MAFDVTDVGRVALGGSMGPEIAQVEGRLIDQENGDYVLSVSTVRLMRGGVQVWSGERVTINKQHVSRSYERRFSTGRTVALGAVVAAGAALLLGRNLDVLGPGDRKTPPIDTIGTFTLPLRPARP